MLNIKAIRQDPAFFERAFARRGLSVKVSDILAVDELLRDAQTGVQQMQNRRNELSKEIGALKSKGQDAAGAMDEVAKLKESIAAQEILQTDRAAALDAMLASTPNVLEDSVPEGPDESANVEIRRAGEPARNNAALDHVAIGENLGMMDFDTAAKLSGSRFVVLHSGLARLERALAQFMLDLHTGEHGYREVSPPLLVRDNCVFGTGQLPKFADDLFKTTRGDWLIPTAEVSLTNMVADMIVDEVDLPLRLTAFTPCFRSEAGAAGKDTRGMIRQHQFYKVEMVSITTPDQSAAEHERMTECAETVLKKLGLPFRTILLCSGDTGFCAQKTYDIEVWMPSQNTYREISSCSNCGDFQARRMNARCRPKGAKDTRFVHTLNGSGVAVGRALVAVLENYVEDDGRVRIPDVLKPYMGGQDYLAPLGEQRILRAA